MTPLRVPLPPGPAGLDALREPLAGALLRAGRAIVPVPTVSMTVSTEYVGSLLAAVNPQLAVEPDTAVVMTTSGSTGNPRAVELTVANFHAVGDLAAPDHAWIAALPLTSIGGFNVAARATMSGTPIVAVDSIGGARPFTPEGFLAAVESCVTELPIATSIVPAQLSRLLGSPAGVRALQTCSTILVGAGATSVDLQSRALAHDIELTLTYGMTETTGGCVFNGRPVGDTTLRIVDGRVEIRGSAVATKYRDTEEQFNGVFLTADAGELNDGMLTITGRIDDLVKINGVNVSPVAVEGVIRSMPSITDAAVISTGEPARLHAFIVTKSAQAMNDAMNLITGQLGIPAVPTMFTELPALPYLPNGKIDRQQLQTRSEM